MSLKIGIIGAGPGGYTAAIRAAQLGARVTVIEQESIGGTCLNWGCIPTKTIIATAEMLEHFKRAKEFGIDLEGDFYPNLERIMVRKNEVVTVLAQGIKKTFASLKIQYLEGAADIQDPNHIRVMDQQGKIDTIETDKVIIASGSRPLDFPAFSFDDQNILSSSDALAIKEVPKSILIVGGGVIGCEFAFIFNALGSQVTVVEALPRILGLPSIDNECSAIIQREMKKRKIKVLLDKTVEKTTVQNGGILVTIGPSPFLEQVREKDRQPISVEVDKVLVSVGRKPAADLLGLDKIGLEVDSKGWIMANERLETNIPGIYAIGDILGPSKIMLAHAASAEGIIAAENIMGHSRTMNYETVPSAIFTFPEVADVGMTETQAREKGYQVQAESFQFRALGKPQAIGEIVGQVKIVFDSLNGKILGLHIVGPQATDLIAEGTLAIRMGATVEDLAHTIHAHPTMSEAVMEAAHKALGVGLNEMKD